MVEGMILLFVLTAILLGHMWYLKQLACTEGIKKVVFLVIYPAVRLLRYLDSGQIIFGVLV